MHDSVVVLHFSGIVLNFLPAHVTGICVSTVFAAFLSPIGFRSSTSPTICITLPKLFTQTLSLSAAGLGPRACLLAWSAEATPPRPCECDKEWRVNHPLSADTERISPDFSPLAGDPTFFFGSHHLYHCQLHTAWKIRIFTIKKTASLNANSTAFFVTLPGANQNAASWNTLYYH